jgi:receptor expression-enhancing protein 1/2/3/4
MAETCRDRIPFYSYIRLLFFLYLILPQTQGSRVIYESYVHPYLEDNESQIEEFIASAHDRLKAAGIAYLKRAIDLLKQNLFGIQPDEAAQPPSPVAGQTYTQSLLARFSMPGARWTGGAAAGAGADFFSLLASAVGAAASAGSGQGQTAQGDGLAASGTLIPNTLRDPTEKMTFIAAQRERLNIILGALDREARTIEREETLRREQSYHTQPRSSGRVVGVVDGAMDDERPPSGLSMLSGLSKSRSEADFEKIDAESGAEDESSLRRRANAQTGGGGSWMTWGWGSAGATPTGEGQSSGLDHHQ